MTEMFQLNSSNGKFDIVFTGVPLVDENVKLKGIRATSAGRRKNAEWKSKLFEKKKDLSDGNKVRSNRTTKLRLEKEKNEKKKHGKPTQAEKDKELNDSSEVPTDTAGVSNGNEDIIHCSSNDQMQDQIPSYNDSFNDNQHVNNANQFSRDKNTSSSATSVPKLDQSFDRRNTFTAKQNGVISQAELDSLYQTFLSEKQKDRAKTGTIKKGLDVQTQNDPDAFISPREKLIREKQASPVEDYYPWGKPGAGAPIRSQNPGMIRSAVRRSKQYWAENELIQDDNAVGETEISSPNSGHTSHVEKASFIRGKVKTIEELEEAEQRRMKQLEHEKAIAKQVEEKRRQKQLEKERKWKEEEEAEEKFRREQEMIERRLKEEKRKQYEKEEERKKKQEAVEEGIRKATEEAIKAKEEARKSRHRSSKKEENPLSSHRKLHDDDEVITARTNYLLDEFRLKLDSSDDEKSHAPSTISKIPKPTKKPPVRKSVKEQTVEETIHHDSSKLTPKEKLRTSGQDDEVKTADRSRSKKGDRIEAETKMKKGKRAKKPELSEYSPRKDESRNDHTPKRRDGNLSSQEESVHRKNKNVVRNKDSTTDKFQELSKLKDDDVIENETANRRKQEDVNKKKKKKKSKEGESYLVPFHRTETSCLITDQVEHQPETKPKESATLSENFVNPESPTSRQQQILSQLQTLRQGLLQKQQEYGGYFNAPYTSYT